MPVFVTREDYFQAAFDILAAEGPGGLRIHKLCTKLGVTTGSLYGYFGSLDGFVDELLEDWLSRHTKQIAELSSTPIEPLQRSKRLKMLVTNEPRHEAEAAIRAWAGSNAAVAKMQERADAERHNALKKIILGTVPDRRRADMLATLGMCIVIGMQQWRRPLNRAELGRMLDQFDILISHHAAEVQKGTGTRASEAKVSFG